MENMSREMIKTCGGLPLAIKVLGGLLAEIYSLQDWKRVSENIGTHLVGGRTNFNDDDNNSFNHVLSLSFEELPSNLKHCFLYLAHFPEDHTISIENLSYYWAAEGIFQSNNYDGETIRNVGDSYVKELVRRNMIISERDVTTERFETCHLHDMMREICLFKAKEENFLQVTSSHLQTANSQSSYRSRRLVCQYPTAFHIGNDVKNQKLRSLVVLQVNGDVGKRCKMSNSRLERVRRLRVLDLGNFRGGKLHSSIGKLIHLRYLNLKDAEMVHRIPSSLGNLILLMYLNIDLSGKDVSVPNVLNGMQDLRYLALPSFMSSWTRLDLSKLVNLEELKNFSTKNSSLYDLHGMSRLRTLGITVSTVIPMETLYASISGLRHLEDLAIDNFILEGKIVWDFVGLKKLSLSISPKKLPRVQHFPSQVTIIKLFGTDLKEDPMPILEKLLKLKEVSISSLCVERLVCQEGGFPQLQKLQLSKLSKWEEWIVEEGSMPLLHILTIDDCQKLKEFPKIVSLKKLEITAGNKIWKERLSEGGEDYKKVEHISSIRL